jgi:hypothetical protein
VHRGGVPRSGDEEKNQTEVPGGHGQNEIKRWCSMIELLSGFYWFLPMLFVPEDAWASHPRAVKWIRGLVFLAISSTLLYFLYEASTLTTCLSNKLVNP